MEYLKNLSGKLLDQIGKRLWAKVLLAMVLGAIAGMLFQFSRASFTSETYLSVMNWLAFPGKLFLKLVQMVMVALVVSSIITGLVGNSNNQLKSIGLKSLFYFVFTTLISVFIGALITLVIKPGAYVESGFNVSKFNDNQAVSGSFSRPFGDFILSLIPDNPLQAFLTGEMLSIVVFSIITGIAVNSLKQDLADSFIKLMGAIQQICMSIVNWAMLIVPYAVFGIMASLTASADQNTMRGLGLYTLTVMIGLALIILFYFLIILFVGRKNPFRFFFEIKDAVLLAFSTTSSAAVMPLSLKIAEETLGIKQKVSRFIIPLGTTINMDGTALYQCVSFLFITQIYHIELQLPALILSLITIIAASIGTPGIPGAGVVVLATVLQGAGIPTEGIVTIMGMERILGMFRSAVNVTGDLTACVVFDKWVK
jgi:Na+/H+-dicarboxylate symporter